MSAKWHEPDQHEVMALEFFLRQRALCGYDHYVHTDVLAQHLTPRIDEEVCAPTDILHSLLRKGLIHQAEDGRDLYCLTPRGMRWLSLS